MRDTNKTQRQEETGHLRDNRKSRRGGQDRTSRGVEGGLEDWAVLKDTHKQSRRPTTRHKQTPDTQKPVSGHSQNPDPQDAQTARDRADEDDRSIPRRDSTDRPTERLTHPPRGKLPRQSAVGAARRAQRAAEAGGLHRPRRRPRRQSAISAAARACPLLEGRPKPPYGAAVTASAAATSSGMDREPLREVTILRNAVKFDCIVMLFMMWHDVLVTCFASRR